MYQVSPGFDGEQQRGERHREHRGDAHWRVELPRRDDEDDVEVLALQHALPVVVVFAVGVQGHVEIVRVASLQSLDKELRRRVIVEVA